MQLNHRSSQSGKTTLYKALTRPMCLLTCHPAAWKCVRPWWMPDDRVDALARLYSPKKIVRTKVSYADIAGLDGSANKDGLPGQLINQIAQMDGLLHVVRVFENASGPHQAGSIDALRDLQVMDSEFILNDLIMVERRLEKLREEHRRGVARPREVTQAEIDIFENLQAMLSQDQPLRHHTFTPEEDKVVASFGFLSRKPQIVVFNIGEDQQPLVYTSPHPLAWSACPPNSKWIWPPSNQRTLPCSWKNLA